MAFIAIKQTHQASIVPSKDRNTKASELKKISDLATFYFNLLSQSSSEGLGSNIQKVNVFLDKLKSLDEDIFNKVFGDIKPIKTSFFSFGSNANKLQIFINELFVKIYREKELIQEDEIKGIALTKDNLKEGFNEYKKDCRRSGDEQKYGTIEMQDNQLEYVLKETKDGSMDLSLLDEKLKKYLKDKKVNEDDIRKFKNFIYYIFSQYGLQQFVVTPILKELDEEFFRPLICEKRDFCEKIVIIDSKTIRVELRSEDLQKEFKMEKKYSFRPDEKKDIHGIKIKNIQSSFVFQLDGEEWQMKDNKTLFTISDIY